MHPATQLCWSVCSPVVLEHLQCWILLVCEGTVSGVGLFCGGLRFATP